MFREQLHESFDKISPSAELLDRVSAMMREEVARKKPPMRLQAVKYGGIAAAVLIGAGGAFALVQSQSGGGRNGGVALENTAAPAADYSAARGEAADEDGFIAEESFYAAGELYGEEPQLDGMTETAAGSAMKIAGETASETAAAETAAAAQNEEAEEEADAEVFDAGAANDGTYVMGDSDTFAANSDEADGMTDSDMFTASGTGSALSEDALQWANPATGAGTDWDLEPTDPKFYLIPLELQVKADGAVKYTEDGYIVGDKWKDYVSAYYVPFGELTAVDKGLNVYTFIKYYGISDDDVRAALTSVSIFNYRYTDEEVDILLSDDKAAIAETFVSQWAIAKGEKLYSPYWLDTHSFDEWRAEGITDDDILQKYDSLIDLPIYLTEEEQRTAYKARIDRFLAGAEDGGGVLYADAGEPAPIDED